MFTTLQILFSIMMWYALISIFQSRFGQVFYILWSIIGSFVNSLTQIESIIWFTIPSYVFYLYSSIVFIFIYKIVHNLYLSWKKT